MTLYDNSISHSRIGNQTLLISITHQLKFKALSASCPQQERMVKRLTRSTPPPDSYFKKRLALYRQGCTGFTA
jgi:hypothetical protein